jgi:4-aminobutyrate aminotransferase-like enzyme/Ser/Thr protein kinase RdoA (MazF antagonist)
MQEMSSTDMTTAITALIKTEYGISGTLTRLAGENENYLIQTETGKRFVLKLADSDTTSGMIEIEYLAVERLIEAGLGAGFDQERDANLTLGLPRVIPTRTGKIEALFLTDKGQPLRGRLLEFVRGQAWCDRLPAAAHRFEALGQTIARINLAMEAIIHPDARRTHHWDLARAQQHRASISLVKNPRHRRILEQVFHSYTAIAMDRFPDLPRSLIHGDINDDNILVDNDRIQGILDFGDCLENPTICDLAIALAYVTLDEPDPLEAASIMVGAYHQIRALSMKELEVLFPLMCTRLAVSVIISAKRRQIDPDRESWFVSEERAWKKLAFFADIPPAEAAIQLASKIELTPYDDRGKPISELVEHRQNCIAPSVKASYAAPLKIVRGKGQYLYDYHGRPFLDLYNNVCHVGHCHPRVVAAGQRQMAQLNTNTRYLYDELTDYAQKLCATLPQELTTCFFVNSGSEANELAVRIAQTVTGNQDMLVVEGAYHGHTQAMINISPYKFMGKGGKGRPEPWVHMVPLADGYRGIHKGQGQETGRAYGDEVGRIIQRMDRPVAGFITESLLSCGGQVIPPKGYFKTAFAHVRAAGGLCITDEVQTGFGRVGSCFWAFELQEVVPDIVVMGKPIGNGHPMSAVVTRREIAERFANGMEFFATFGGNPVSCAIGQAVLEVIEEEGLQAHARRVGHHLIKGLSDLKPAHPLMGDVRGIGLFIGIELVLDHRQLTPAAQEAADLVNRLKNRGILLGTDGPFSNVIKIKPPLVMTLADADMFLRILDDELTEMENPH